MDTPSFPHVAEPAELIGFVARDRPMDAVRRRARNLGAESLDDRELLALQLCDSGEDDVLDLADRLLRRFGSLANVLAAPEATLCHLMGADVARTVSTAREMGRRVLLEPILKRKVLDNWRALQDFLRHEMARSEVEIFGAVWLDNKNQLIRYEQMWDGDGRTAPVFPKQFVRRAIERGASNCIIAHCHPSFSAQPSQADILMTRKLKEGLALVDIGLHDHVIVAGDQVVSMQTLGLL